LLTLLGYEKAGRIALNDEKIDIVLLDCMVGGINYFIVHKNHRKYEILIDLHLGRTSSHHAGCQSAALSVCKN